ncbi:hypothetical protein EBR43_07690 [bacterium]|nr:hypothetical protein [bacterium]
MKIEDIISEVDLVGNNTFPLETAKRYLDQATPNGMLEEFNIMYAEFSAGNIIQIAIILTDIDNQIAAYAGFVSRLNGRVWQARAAASYPPYSGQALVGKMYKHIKEVLKKSIQSDDVQTLDGKKLWTKILPGLGLNPMILDTKTHQIYDPKDSGKNIDVYPPQDDPDVGRYIWILEKFDRYPQQNILTEGLLMPYTNLWYVESNIEGQYK